MMIVIYMTLLLIRWNAFTSTTSESMQSENVLISFGIVVVPKRSYGKLNLNTVLERNRKKINTFQINFVHLSNKYHFNSRKMLNYLNKATD